MEKTNKTSLLALMLCISNVISPAQKPKKEVPTQEIEKEITDGEETELENEQGWSSTWMIGSTVGTALVTGIATFFGTKRYCSKASSATPRGQQQQPSPPQ